MGNFFSRIFGPLMGSKEYRILMLGLNNAGKTSILFKMNLGEYIQVAPSMLCLALELNFVATAFNVENVEKGNIKF